MTEEHVTLKQRVRRYIAGGSGGIRKVAVIAVGIPPYTVVGENRFAPVLYIQGGSSVSCNDAVAYRGRAVYSEIHCASSILGFVAVKGTEGDIRVGKGIAVYPPSVIVGVTSCEKTVEDHG